MCQILFSQTANPPVEAMTHANEANKDGFGFAWVDGGLVHWSKGFENKDLNEEMISAYLALPFPKAIHFRLATHGGAVQQLTHPFPVKRGVPHDLQGSGKAVLFHNGVWNAYDDRLREAVLSGTINPNILKGGLSDSRAMAILAQRFGDEFIDIMDIGSNKVLILKANDWITWGSWNQKEGWSASSSNIFRPSPTVSTRGMESKGVVLDKSGLPIKGYEIVGGAQAGHLNRHGNVRQRFRERYSDVGIGNVDQEAREMGPSGSIQRLTDEEEARDSAFAQMREYNKTEKPSEGSAYLSASAEEIARNLDDWGQWGVS